MNYNKAWRQRNPEKTKAHWTVQNALRNGKLIKQPCEICGKDKTHAHHDDYSQPLCVKWLCHTCHVDTHHPHRHKQKVPHPANPLIITAKEMRANGKTYREIAAQLGCSHSQVYKWTNKCKYK